MPPETDANIEELDPSSISDLDAQPETSTEVKADDATSSPATGETDDSLLSVVRDVVTESRKDQTASPAEGEEDGLEADGKPKEQDNEEYSDVPFHKHPRFQHLLKELKTEKVDAQRYRNVEGFLTKTGLSSEEAADGLTIMALIKTDPQSAWERLKPIVSNLLIAAGEVLPDNLKQRVDAGEMSREAAIELSRALAAQQAVKTQQTFAEQQREREAASNATNAIRSAAGDWEADRRKRDPNFDAKLVPLQKEILFLQQTEGKPNTPEGVKAQLQKAYKAVNEALAPTPAAPKPAARPAIRPITGGQVAGGQKPENMSTLDIVRANRRSA